MYLIPAVENSGKPRQTKMKEMFLTPHKEATKHIEHLETSKAFSVISGKRQGCTLATLVLCHTGDSNMNSKI